MQSTWKNLMTIWNNYWDLSTMINITGNFVEIWKLWLSYYDWKLDILSNVIFLWMSQPRQNLSLHQEKRATLELGRKNIQYPPLAESKKNLLQLLRIIFCLMNNFVKTMGKTKASFKYVQNKFPRISKAKIKAGNFFGPSV